MVWPSLLAQGLEQRDDIERNLHDIMCDGRSYQKRAAWWAKGVFDAQATGHLIDAPTGKTLKIEQLVMLAKTKATSRHHGGYAARTCSPQTGWIITTLSEEGFVKDNKYLTIPAKHLRSQCRQYRVDFMGHDNQLLDLTPADINKDKKSQITVSRLPPGMISVRCFPQTPSWKGPELWALVPHRVESLSAPVGIKQPSTDPTAALAEWVNDTRKSQGLEPLQSSKALEDSIARLWKTKNITHDRRIIKPVREKLSAQGLLFLGENKAMSANLNQATHLFWTSPTHRKLLLEQKATHLAVKVSKVNESFFTLIVIAQKRKTSE